MTLRQTQCGQAMFEIMVASSFILIPFFFMVSYLGKVGDTQHRAYEGARYAAWEHAITNKSDVQISNELNKRILYDRHADFDSEDDRQGNNNRVNQLDNLYHHTDDNGNYSAYLVQNNNSFVSAASVNEAPTGGAHRLRSSTLNSGLVNYDLDERGMMRASVEYRTAATKHFDLADGLRPRAHNVLYIESWRQVTNDAVIDAMQGAVFGERAFNNPVFNTIATLGGLIGFQEWDDFEPGFVRPDVVPCSRVIGGGGNRETACF